MPTPTYVSAGSVTKGVTDAESGINVSSFRESFANPKEEIMDRFGGVTGIVTDFNVSSTCTIEGEVNTALTAVLGVAWATAEVVANSTVGYGLATGDYLMDDIEISQDRGSLVTASINLTRVEGMTVA